jgi:Ca2+-binding RTX toxin-like protein
MDIHMTKMITSHVSKAASLVGGTELFGTAGDDILIGRSGNDILHGSPGNDQLSGGGGDDVFVLDSGDTGTTVTFPRSEIKGGAGFDTIDFSNASSGVNVDLKMHYDLTGLRHDLISGVEGIKGGAHNDSLAGDKHDNVIDGGAGNDYIRGGKGADVLTGGTGNDWFLWNKSDVGTGVDHIKDFGNGADILYLHDVLKNAKGLSTDNVQLIDAVDGSHLWAKIGGSFQEVAVLDGVHNTSAADLIKAGMLLV